MSFSLKVILVLHLGPWKFWKLQMGPFSPSPVCPSLSHRRPTVPRRPPPFWAGRRPTPVSPPLHASSLDPWTHYPLALELPSLATPPRSSSRLPPRRPPTGARRRPQFRLLLGRAHPRALFLAIPSTLGLTNRSAEPCFSIPPPLPSICAAARRPPVERPPRTSTSPVRPLNRTPLVP